MRFLGKTVEMARFPEESHDLSRSGRPDRRVERLERIASWFERFLGTASTEKTAVAETQVLPVQSREATAEEPTAILETLRFQDRVAIAEPAPRVVEPEPIPEPARAPEPEAEPVAEVAPAEAEPPPGAVAAEEHPSEYEILPVFPEPEPVIAETEAVVAEPEPAAAIEAIPAEVVPTWESAAADAEAQVKESPPAEIPAEPEPQPEPVAIEPAPEPVATEPEPVAEEEPTPAPAAPQPEPVVATDATQPPKSDVKATMLRWPTQPGLPENGQTDSGEAATTIIPAWQPSEMPSDSKRTVSLQAMPTEARMSGEPYAAKLTFESGPFAGRVVALPDQLVTVGRAPDNDVVVGDPATSGRHGRIEVRAGAFWISDLGSTNGTLVNGEPVIERQLLDGDLIAIGQNTIRFTLA
jgi:hypothetical protein